MCLSVECGCLEMGIGFPGTGTIHRCDLPLRVRDPDPLQEPQMLLIAELSLHPGLQKLLMRIERRVELPHAMQFFSSL